MSPTLRTLFAVLLIVGGMCARRAVGRGVGARHRALLVPRGLGLLRAAGADVGGARPTPGRTTNFSAAWSDTAALPRCLAAATEMRYGGFLFYCWRSLRWRGSGWWIAIAARSSSRWSDCGSQSAGWIRGLIRATVSAAPARLTSLRSRLGQMSKTGCSSHGDKRGVYGEFRPCPLRRNG